MKTGILLSGGMDSCALAHWKRPEVAFCIDYGQRAAVGEMRAAAEISKVLGIQFERIEINCRSLGSGDLAGSPAQSIAPVSEWWPFRNQLLITLAATRAITMNIDTLLVGSVANDSAHKDGTHEFYAAMDHVTSLQEGQVRICAPAVGLTSVELIRNSRVPISVLAWSHSCHIAEVACGRCRGCSKHREVMSELGHGSY